MTDAAAQRFSSFIRWKAARPSSAQRSRCAAATAACRTSAAAGTSVAVAAATHAAAALEALKASPDGRLRLGLLHNPKTAGSEDVAAATAR